MNTVSKTLNVRLLVIVGCFLLLVGILGPVGMSLANRQGKPDETYIIIFRDGVETERAIPDVAQAHGLRVRHEYRNAVHGMAADVPPGRLNALQNDPRVASVELDQVVSMSEQFVPTGVQRILASTNPNLTINGADDLRIDVDVAVLDSGIDLQHPDLNIFASTDCMTGTCLAGGDDDNGHGTHVAGTIAALDNNYGVVGVAPGARLWAVKVLDLNGDGSFSTLIAGLDYVAAHANEIEVANLSLGCICESAALDQALSNTLAAGVTVVVAAGNENIDAAGYSPANHPDVITVSAVADFDGIPGGQRPATCYADQDDTLADFSNFGTTVDIAAPGVCIYSTFPVEKGAYASSSGTSMAAPHVAGAAALLQASGDYTPAQIRQTLIDNGQFNWTDTSADGVQEALLNLSSTALFAPATVAGAPAPNAAPVVTITSPATGASYSATSIVAFWASASDPEDGNVNASLVWTSSLVGQIGTGYSFNKNLPGGTHVITVTARDSSGLTGSASITVTFAAAPPPTPTLAVTLSSSKTTYTTAETATITVNVTSNGAPVSGASVTLTITTAKGGTQTMTALTNSSGVATFLYKPGSKNGLGTFTLTARAAKSGFTASPNATTTFTVR